MAGCSEPSKIMKDDVASSSSSTSFKDSLKKDCQLSKKQVASFPSRWRQTGLLPPLPGLHIGSTEVYEDQFLGGKDEVPFSTTPSLGSVYPSDARYPSRLPQTSQSFFASEAYECLTPREKYWFEGERQMEEDHSILEAKKGATVSASMRYLRRDAETLMYAEEERDMRLAILRSEMRSEIRRSNTATSKSDFLEKPSSVDVSSLFNDNCWAPPVLSLPHNRFIDYCDEILQNIKELQIKLHNIEDQEKVVQKSPLSDDRDGILNNKSIASHIRNARLNIDRIKFFIIDQHDVFSTDDSTDDLRREILRLWNEIKCDILKLSHSYFSSIEAQFYCDQVIRNLKSLKFFVQARIKHQQHMYREKSQNLSHNPRSFWDRDSLASDPGDVKKDSFSEVEIAGSTVGSEETKGETLGLVDFQHLKLDDLPADTETPTTVIKENVGKVNVYDSESSVSKDALEPGPDGIPEVSSSTVDVVGSTSARSDSEETISTTELYDFQELKFDNRPTNTKTTTEVKDNAKVTVARLDSGETKEFNDFQELDLDDYTLYSLGDGITKKSSSAVDNVSPTVATLQSAETIKETLRLDDFQQLRLDDDFADSESSAEISHENGGDINVYDSELSVSSKDALEQSPDGIPGDSPSTVDDIGFIASRSDSEEAISTKELNDFQELQFDKPSTNTKTTTKVIDERGGKIDIYDCFLRVPPKAVKSPTEFQLTVSDYADDFPDEMLRITPVLECKPSMSFERPVMLRMRTNFCAMDGQRIPAKILYKKGGNNWTVVEHVSLRNRNVVEFQLLHFCKYCFGIDQEVCSQGLYHFYNDVYIQRKTAQITSVFCRNKTTRDEIENQIRKKNFISLLPVPEEIEVKLDQNIEVKFNCSRTSEVQLKNIKPKARSFRVTEEILRRDTIPNSFIPSSPMDNQTGQLLINYRIILDKLSKPLLLVVYWPIEEQTDHIYNVSTEINNGPVVSKYTVKSGGNMKATEDSASSTITLGDNVETSHSSGGH